MKTLLHLVAFLEVACLGASAQSVTNIKFQNGPSPVPNGGRLEILSSKGQKTGTNLFHSFSDFSVGTGCTAVFKTPADVSTILARVTGGAASKIDGTLRTEQELSGSLSGADLYLINPAGILFGPNAKLEIGGSFTATTADYVKLSDGGRFDARHAANDVLTTAPVSAFGFLAPAPKGVSFTGSMLATQPGAGLRVVAGSVRLEAAHLSAPSGALTLHATAVAGEVLAEETTGSPRPVPATLGAVELLQGAVADIDGAGGGRLAIRAGALTLDGASRLSSANRGALAGGDIDLWADALHLRGGSRIAASAFSTGRGGAVQVMTRDGIEVDGDDGGTLYSSIRSRSELGASGDAGLITIETAGTLSLTRGGDLNGRTDSLGRAPDILVKAGALAIAGRTPLSAPGIFSRAGSSTGDAGSLTLEITGELSLRDGRIDCSTTSAGNGGNFIAHAGSLVIDGSAFPDATTGILVQTSGGAGRAGDLHLEVDGSAKINGAGLISVGTFAAGQGGTMYLHAGSLTMDGSAAPNRFTGLSAQASANSTGLAGTLNVTVDGALELKSGAEISTSRHSGFTGGDIIVHAGSLSMAGLGFPLVTGILAIIEKGDAGAAGRLEVTVAHAIDLQSGGQISGTTTGIGRGGALTVKAETIRMDGAGSGLFSNSGNENVAADGDAGSAEVVARSITITDQARIGAEAYGAGRGGKLIVRTDALRIDGSASPEFVTGIRTKSIEDATGRAGSIVIRPYPRIVGLAHRAGAITLLGGGQISAGTDSDAAAGDIDIRVGTIRMRGDFSGVFCNSNDPNDDYVSSGRGGSISIEADDLSLFSGARIVAITFSQGHGGDIAVRAGRLLIDGEASTTFTGIAASAETFSENDAGNLRVTVDGRLLLRNGGSLSTETSGTGRGGSLTVQAGTLTIGRPDLGERTTGLFSETNADATGDAGNLTVRCQGLLRVQGGGTISVRTRSGGAGGDLSVQAGTLALDLTGTISASTDAPGRGGDIDLAARTIRIDGAGAPLAETGIFAQANNSLSGGGGTIRAQAGDITVSGGGTISTASFGPSAAGDLFLNLTGGLSLASQSALSSTATRSRAGRVEVRAGGPIDLTGSAITVRAKVGNAGDILIRTPRPLTLRDSSLTAAAGGSGGNLDLGAGSLTLAHSTISADAVSGDGGRIALEIPAAGVLGDARDFVLASSFVEQSSDSRISASSTFGIQGSLLISAPFVDLAGSLETLPLVFFDASTQLRDQCARKLQRDFSSYLRLGRGGQAERPEEAGASF